MSEKEFGRIWILNDIEILLLVMLIIEEMLIQTFLDNDNFNICTKDFDFTCCRKGSKYVKIVIDHFIVSENLADFLQEY